MTISFGGLVAPGWEVGGMAWKYEVKLNKVDMIYEEKINKS